jgi:hypothetical protein
VTPARELFGQVLTAARATSAGHRAVRTLVLLTGVVIFAVEPDHGGTLAGAVAWVVLLIAPFAATLPASDAPLGLLLAGVISWVAGWGGHLPPVAPTLVLGAALYLHHLGATLAAASVAHATFDRALIRRWTLPLVTGALGLAAAALAAYRTEQLPLSPVLQFAGLVGVLTTAGAIVVLARR